MEEVKTANSHRHNRNKNFNKYLKTKSTRSLHAIYRTKRLDIGFFWLEYLPLLIDMFLIRHKDIKLNDFWVLAQLHANQPFDIDDIYDCTTMKINIHDGVWDKKTSMGIKAVKKFIYRNTRDDIFRIWKNRGRYNKTLYIMSPQTNTEFERIYNYMLCITKIRSNDKEVVDPLIKKSKAHLKKIIKQNNYYEAFPKELETEIKTTDGEFAMKLRNLRINKV